MNGLDVLLTALCMNVMCNVTQAKNENDLDSSFYDSISESSGAIKQAQANSLKKELKGRTLRVTTIQVK
jgi:hypothetical protein